MTLASLYAPSRTEPTVGINLHISHAGRHGAVVAHTHARLSPDQADMARIHATELTDVKRKTGLLTAGTTRGAALHFAGSGLHFVDPCDHVELLCVDLGIDLDGSGQNTGVVGQTGVQALAVDAEGAALHPVAL